MVVTFLVACTNGKPMFCLYHYQGIFQACCNYFLLGSLSSWKRKTDQKTN